MRTMVVTDDPVETMQIGYNESSPQFILSRRAKEYDHKTGAQTLGKPTILFLTPEQVLKVVVFVGNLGKEG